MALAFIAGGDASKDIKTEGVLPILEASNSTGISSHCMICINPNEITVTSESRKDGEFDI